MLEEIESNKFSTIEKIHHLIELKKAVKNKLELLGKRGLEEDDGNLIDEMAPKMIEYAFEEEEGFEIEDSDNEYDRALAELDSDRIVIN